MKKKLAKRIGSLESLRAKMLAKYGAADPIVADLDKELEVLRSSAQAKVALFARVPTPGIQSTPSVQANL